MLSAHIHRRPLGFASLTFSRGRLLRERWQMKTRSLTHLELGNLRIENVLLRVTIYDRDSRGMMMRRTLAPSCVPLIL
jgi:hypothetical protein